MENFELPDDSITAALLNTIKFAGLMSSIGICQPKGFNLTTDECDRIIKRAEYMKGLCEATRRVDSLLSGMLNSDGDIKVGGAKLIKATEFAAIWRNEEARAFIVAAVNGSSYEEFPFEQQRDAAEAFTLIHNAAIESLHE